MYWYVFFFFLYYRWSSLQLVSTIAVVIYVACPIIVHLSPPVQNALVFLNYGTGGVVRVCSIPYQSAFVVIPLLC